MTKAVELSSAGLTLGDHRFSFDLAVPEGAFVAVTGLPVRARVRSSIFWPALRGRMRGVSFSVAKTWRRFRRASGLSR